MITFISIAVVLCVFCIVRASWMNSQIDFEKTYRSGMYMLTHFWIWNIDKFLVKRKKKIKN